MTQAEMAASLTSRAKWGVLLAVGVGTFMTALDGSVVNIILPVLRVSFSTTVANVEWVVTTYLLVVSGLLLGFGRLGDLRGHKSVYMAGFGLFILGSALCGLAPSIGALIGFRGLQALGGAMLFANSPAILTKSFPPAQRGQALGLQGAMTYLGLTVGPSLGGLLAAQVGWRWVFYLNVPVALAAAWLSLRFVPGDAGEASGERFDLLGAGLFLAGLVTLLLALNQGEEWGWGSTPILGLGLLAVALLSAFVMVERRLESPMLDLRLFSNITFTSATASAVINYMCVYGLLFLMPFYLIQGRAMDSEKAGLVLTALPLVMAVAAPISGTLSDRIGPRIPSVIGMGVLSASLLLVSRLTVATPMGLIAAGLGLAGLGIGIFVAPNTSALLGSAPRVRQGIASGILATGRNVGMVLGVGLAGAIFTTVLGSARPDALFYGIAIAFLAFAGIAALGAAVAGLRQQSRV